MIISLVRPLLTGSSDQPIPPESGIYLVLHRVGFAPVRFHNRSAWALTSTSVRVEPDFGGRVVIRLPTISPLPCPDKEGRQAVCFCCQRCPSLRTGRLRPSAVRLSLGFVQVQRFARAPLTLLLPVPVRDYPFSRCSDFPLPATPQSERTAIIRLSPATDTIPDNTRTVNAGLDQGMHLRQKSHCAGPHGLVGVQEHPG